MKKTKTVIIARIFILLAVMLLLFAIITPNALSNIYITGVLYLLAIISFAIGAIVAFIASSKDKEFQKTRDLVQKDERLKEITMRSKAKAFDVITYILALSTGYLCLSKIIDTNAMIVLGVLNLVLLGSQLYYFCRYPKEM